MFETTVPFQGTYVSFRGGTSSLPPKLFPSLHTPLQMIFPLSRSIWKFGKNPLGKFPTLPPLSFNKPLNLQLPSRNVTGNSTTGPRTKEKLPGPPNKTPWVIFTDPLMVVHFPSQKNALETHRIHIWYICLHLP